MIIPESVKRRAAEHVGCDATMAPVEARAIAAWEMVARMPPGVNDEPALALEAIRALARWALTGEEP